MSGGAPAIAVIAAGPLDAAVLAALHEGCFEDQPWGSGVIVDIMAMPGAVGLLALAGDTPAGFVLARSAADEYEILSIGVPGPFRRRGVARALLRRSLRVGAAAGAGRVFLEVAEDNAAARALYESEGFEAVGRREGYYRREPAGTTGAVVLARPLP